MSNIFNYFLCDEKDTIHNFIINDSNEQTLKLYNKNSCLVNENSLLSEYDFVFMFLEPLHFVDNHMYTKWLPSGNTVIKSSASTTIEDYRNNCRKYKNILSKIKYSKIIIVDTSDRSIYKDGGFEFIRSNICSQIDLILKREYRRTYEYSYKKENVKPFPYMTFSSEHVKKFYIDPYHEKNIHGRLNCSTWAGAELYRVELGLRDEWVNRYYMLRAIEKLDNSIVKVNLPRDQYMECFKKFKMFIHLNGTGHLCHRFFEGLSTDTLMLWQENDVILPSSFHELCVFEHPEEYAHKVNILKTNVYAFNEAYAHQRELIKKYFNQKYIKDFIFNSLK